MNMKGKGLRFFKEFFGACIKDKENIFVKIDATLLIDYFIHNLFYAIKDVEIEPINDGENNVDSQTNNKKYVKNLIKYILAFCNILNDSDYNNKYNTGIFKTFIKIEDKFFHEYFLKQLYKIAINKGVYKYGKVFARNIFYPIIHKNNEISLQQHKKNCSSFINSLFKNIIDFLEIKNSPRLIIKIIVLNKIMDELCVDEELKKAMLFKFIKMFNHYINLFIDDGSQLEVAEFILTDSVNNHIIMNNLNKLELIKKSEDNIFKKQYFKYLFFNLGGEIFLNSKGDNILSQIDLQSSNRDSIDNFISSEITSNYIIKDENLKRTKTITGVFFNSEDIFISKYFNDKTYLAEEEYINIIII